MSLGQLEWPTSPTVDVQSFAYPDDGSIVSLGRSRGAVFAAPNRLAPDRARGRSSSRCSGARWYRSGRYFASAGRVPALSVRTFRIQVQGCAFGSDVSTAPGSTTPLEDWDRCPCFETPDPGKPLARRASVSGLLLRLTADHGVFRRHGDPRRKRPRSRWQHPRRPRPHPGPSAPSRRLGRPLPRARAARHRDVPGGRCCHTRGNRRFASATSSRARRPSVTASGAEGRHYEQLAPRRDIFASRHLFSQSQTGRCTRSASTRSALHSESWCFGRRVHCAHLTAYSHGMGGQSVKRATSSVLSGAPETRKAVSHLHFEIHPLHCRSRLPEPSRRTRFARQRADDLRGRTDRRRRGRAR